MIFRSRSTQGGKRLAWLHRAADIRLVGIEPDAHDTLLFEAPSLGMAAPKFYQQRDLFWIPPDPEDTGFDLLGDVLADVPPRIQTAFDSIVRCSSDCFPSATCSATLSRMQNSRPDVTHRKQAHAWMFPSFKRPSASSTKRRPRVASES